MLILFSKWTPKVVIASYEKEVMSINLFDKSWLLNVRSTVSLGLWHILQP